MILNIEQLKEEAYKSALKHDPFLKRKTSRRFWKVNQADIENLREFVSQLREKSSSCTQPAEEWLLDNAEFIEEQILVIHHELSKKAIRSLPHLSKNGDTRVFSICTDYLKHTDGNINLDSLLTYINSYQEVSVLTMAEVWAIPMFMRIALIRRLSEIMNILKERHEVCSFVDQLIAKIETEEITPEILNTALEESGQEMPLSGPMIVHLVTHLRERADQTATVGEWLICKLENGPKSLDHILSYEYQLQASFGLTTGNIITSLRKLSRWNWQDSFEKISFVEQTLRKECTGTYQSLDFTSRETLRKKIEYLSQRFHLPENLVATQAVEEVAEFVKPNEGKNTDKLPRQAYVSYYLLEPVGIEALREGLKRCGKPRMIQENGIMKHSTGTYFNILAACFIFSLIVFSLWISWGEFISPLQWIFVLLALSFPAMEWAVSAIHWMIEKVKKPVPLLRYDFSSGVPQDASTIVVVPVIWSTVEEVKEMADRLELHYLANNYRNIHFALLGDFKDEQTETLPEDEILLKVARKKIEQLNHTYPDTPFHLFQRKRKWNDSEGVWMGWERKRGKLVEFIEWLKGHKDTSFIITDGDLSFLKKARYVITLDADTKLPLESAQRMIGTLHFPYNQPRLNKTKTRVTEGYGVLQPRIGLSHEATMKSRLAKLWSADPGIDPYAFAVSDVYQDGLDQGIFTGKGIFDIDAFYQVLCERIPENRVLSHDLLEGGFLRTGLLSNIELIDDHPSRFSIYQRRLHRWVRGDWQLLLWLFPKNDNRRGEIVPVDLSTLTRWQIFDNLRRSLLSPALFTILLLSLVVLPGSALKWFAVVGLTWLIPVIRQIASIHTISKDSKGLRYTVGQVLVSTITLPYQCILLLDAIFRTLYRLLVSKQHLLEWVSSADEERRKDRKNGPILHGMFGAYVLIALFLFTAYFYDHLGVQLFSLLLAVLWASAPIVIGWLDKPILEERLSFSEEEEMELRKLSREIWSFYEDYVTEEDNWLPPDNVQIDPPNGIAHRTSPTNIGLYMTCALAARDFDFIDTPGLIRRLERTLDTIEKLEKWNGHIYNWYDTVSLRPLTPMYVSTVDSGNFVGCLITIKEGLIEWLETDYEQMDDFEYSHKDLSYQIAFSEELTPISSGKVLQQETKENWFQRGKQLLKRMDNLIQETDFRPLYDHHAKLFSLGYHIERNERDEVLYDLMASEARQASFIAIALGQISVSHWNSLGRTMTLAGNRPLLLSWSGTMFEYLMPWLFMRTYRNTLWEQTYSAVVNRQIEYAEQRGVPFGISESGFYAFDYLMNYQYRAFGVPGLGFKRGLERDLVVAPYATILAMPFAKEKALESLKKIEDLQARGKYGFYEAIDFTKRRLPKDKPYIVIRSFMAHHQGMSLLTLANLLMPKTIYERFHQNKYIQSAELLLQERLPKRPKLIKHPAMNREHVPVTKEAPDVTSLREYRSPHTETPEVCILSNGTFTTIMTNSGSGLSLYKGLHVSRWREDPIMDPWGSYVYIRDITNDKVWSPSYQPCRIETTDQLVQFSMDRATFSKTVDGIKAVMEVSVSPEYNAEIRRISLTNASDKAKVLEITTFSELALANPIADDAHTAFSKLFIRTAFDSKTGCLVAGRRPREKKDQTLWAAHSLMVEGSTLGTIEYETDRASFIGRGHRLSNPQSIRIRLRGKIGSVADPAFVMKRRVNIKPGETVQLVAITSVGETKEEAIDTIQRIRPDQSVERAFQMAWNRAQIELRHLHLSSKEAANFQTLAGQILYHPPLKKEYEQMIVNNKKGQSGLWSFGISGDRPIILVRIDNQSQLPFVVKLLTGHEYLRRLGFLFDLVLLNESVGGYQQNLQEALQSTAEHGVDRFGQGLSGVYAIPTNQLATEDITLLMAVSRIILYAGGASLKAQLRLSATQEDALPEKLIPSITGTNPFPPSTSNILEDRRDWQFYNGWGGFSPDGKEYRMLIKNGNFLPAPWINVLANPKFGCLLSEMGTGYTWWRNSREFKLTPWSNDPVLDAPTETAFLRDEQSGVVWSITPSAVKHEAPYKITHGRGFTRYDHERNGILHEMIVYVPLEDPVKIMKVRLQNKTSVERKVSLTYYAEWVLGVQRPANATHTVTEWIDEANIMTAKNTYQEIFKESTAFLGIFPESKSPNMEQSWTADRLEFIGRNRSMEYPEALDRAELSCRTGVFYETCGVIQQKVTLMPESEQTLYIILGCEDSNDAVLHLAKKYRQSSACEEALDDIHQFWEYHLGQITVETPSNETNILLNGWLLYQSLACRMWARTAFYQAGGAYGFRDQLQDSLSMLHTLPELTRKQILLHAAHQYEEGDVQHWWHEETERGIRTFFTDDLLWLPYTVSRYVEHTGDRTILGEVVPYLHSEPLKEDEHERYEPTVKSSQSGTIYEHCLRAIDKALERIGEHGIPLMGVGDWNDGMNLVGANGRGESVWLGWFISDILNRFVTICNQLGEKVQAQDFLKKREELLSSLNEHAWDGQWYRRAFTDDGQWLGSIESEECQIDAIAQSWSIISRGAPEDRALQAMNSFDRELVDRELSLIRLLTPAFDKTEPSPGYIQGYPPGLRENGGQYTHGVIWGIVAWCLLDQGDHAHEMFTILNPINHTRTDLEVRRYVGEPYAIAADVYTAEPKEGHAGWTWYTGAAGWLYQAGIEWILGIKRRENKLFINPKIPSNWPKFSFTYRFGKTNYNIEVLNKTETKKPYLIVDGSSVSLSDYKDSPFVELVDDGIEHYLELQL